MNISEWYLCPVCGISVENPSSKYEGHCSEDCWLGFPDDAEFVDSEEDQHEGQLELNFSQAEY